MSLRVLCLGVLLGGAAAVPCLARVVRVEVRSRAPLEDGTSGAMRYEQVKGVVYGDLDPEDRHNRIIQDLQLSPRDARGHVEYAATFTLLVPLDPAKRSGFLVYEVVNRGGSIVPKDFTSGDVFLSSGWQGDLPFGGPSVYGTPGETVQVPVARQPDGSPVTGPVLLRFSNMKPGLHSLPTRAASGYASSGPAPEPLDLDTSHARLTTRTYESTTGVSGPVATISADDWRWADCTELPFPGKPDPTHVCTRAALDPTFLYQVEYTGKHPLVLGVGLAAMRDVVSYFRNGEQGGNTERLINSPVRYAIGVGASQSGNAIRTALNLGFNEDEAGRTVWDGVMPTIAARQTPINLRFAVPGGASNLYEPGSDGTVWWSHNEDAVRGLPASGLLDRCTGTQTCPKVIEVLGSSEFWSLRATPDFVGTSERNDLGLPANVRRYFIASTQHGGGAGGFVWHPHPAERREPSTQNPIATAGCVLPLNPNPEVEIDNALLVALKQWVQAGKEPPPSAYPKLSDGTLARANAGALGMPFVPGLPSPEGVANPLLVYDFGASFRANDLSGLLTREPPTIRDVLPAMAPVVDADGNEIAGVRTVLLQAPLGTYLGWNVTANGFAKGQYCSLNGSYVPFAKTS